MRRLTVDILKAAFAVFSASALLAQTSCDVHEFPDPSGETEFVLRLNYETDLPIWNQVHENGQTSAVQDTSYNAVPEDTVRGILPEGTMNYVIRAYPMNGDDVASSPSAEFTFTRDISEGYDCEFGLTLPDGDYKLMVWSDFSAMDGKDYYDYSDLRSVALKDVVPNTDYRDAFRGREDISLESSTEYHLPDTIDVAMQRPLAKYEFITTDLAEFISTRLSMQGLDGSLDNLTLSDEDLAMYRIIFAYYGYMPTKFSVETDKPVDSKTGVIFESKLKYIGEQEASMGFDYVFVNTHQTSVSVQIGIYTRDGTLLSVSDPIEVPLKRSWHTVVRGKFLTSAEAGEIGIDPGYGGDHNVIL